ncbi:MAG: DNA repair protein RecN [Chlorobium sp.]|jgi:DNA repair protein RecN (Recombination protein N)|nr:MAG: DNA repair protein RecN [Chlorobium sp.]
MLFSLYIKNYALIQELTVEFSPGLNIITGETGAGKSILIGALNLVLGERASSDLVRSGTTKAVIEAILKDVHSEKVNVLLSAANIETTPELILRRELSSSGQSRCFINDSPCNASLLKQAGEILIDLHGQHDHQLLLNADSHETLLDDFAQSDSDVTDYKAARFLLLELQNQLNTLNKEAAEIRDKKETLDFQINELKMLDLKNDEYKDIETEISLLENSETLFSLTSSLNDLLYDCEHSIYTSITSALHTLEKLASIDKRFDIHVEETRTVKSIVDEIARFTRSYSSVIDFNPARLDSLRERQLKLQRICKKYGLTLTELIDYQNELDARVALEDSLEEEVNHIKAKITLQKAELSILALRLSGKRQKAAHQLEKVIQEQLAQLGIPNATFIVNITHDEQDNGEISNDGKRFACFSCGYDRIEFMISTNPGEKPKPLIKVASGGEISRIMLAMKSALADSAKLPILIFDEIDTGISGRVAEAVALSLKKLSRLHQIIAITHLPQIAAMADTHLQVQKSLQHDRTVSEVITLDHKSRLKAIAGLISGTEVSHSSLNLASELLDRGKSI